VPDCSNNLAPTAGIIDRLIQCVKELSADNEKLMRELDKRSSFTMEEVLARVKPMLPNESDFYIKKMESRTQHAEEKCDGSDILISAACTNHFGAQAAVGPQFFQREGQRWAACDRYGGTVWEAEGQLICMRLH
jgi:hypothetical protein